jgi:hypothetical protein
MRNELLKKANYMRKTAQGGMITMPRDASNIQLLGGMGGGGGGGMQQQAAPAMDQANSATIEDIMYNAVDGMNRGIAALGKVVEKLSPSVVPQEAAPQDMTQGISQDLPPEVLARLFQEGQGVI